MDPPKDPFDFDAIKRLNYGVVVRRHPEAKMYFLYFICGVFDSDFLCMYARIHLCPPFQGQVLRLDDVSSTAVIELAGRLPTRKEPFVKYCDLRTFMNYAKFYPERNWMAWFAQCVHNHVMKPAGAANTPIDDMEAVHARATAHVAWRRLHVRDDMEVNAADMKRLLVLENNQVVQAEHVIREGHVVQTNTLRCVKVVQGTVVGPPAQCHEDEQDERPLDSGASGSGAADVQVITQITQSLADLDVSDTLVPPPSFDAMHTFAAHVPSSTDQPIVPPLPCQFAEPMREPEPEQSEEPLREPEPGTRRQKKRQRDRARAQNRLEPENEP